MQQLISILIPVYNFDVIQLIDKLHYQAQSANITFEIIVIDDYSDKKFRNINQCIDKHSDTQYIQLTKNIGRAKIRNMLAEHAKYDYLLFMDCDSEIISDDYIIKYIEYCRGEVVVCGGRIYEKYAPVNCKYYLHWYYGVKRESIPVNKRSKNPNRSFMTNNFLISKSVFQKIKFDESLDKYGHEDTLFGYELKKLGFAITHIDNSVKHLDLEDNLGFLEKTKQGIANLNFIINTYKSKDDLFEDVKILYYYRKISKIRLTKLIGFIFKIFQNRIIKNLTGKNPKLIYLDFYKLGYFLKLASLRNNLIKPLINTDKIN